MAEERVQRRLAAILAADVVGYSRLMGEDEEGTLATLTAHLTELIEPCIAEHNGRVVKTTGDGLLAEFASVVDAVCCAVAFQQGMSKRNGSAPGNRLIQFRVGVNLGDVIVQDEDIFGDGVNVAARLEGLAAPGGIIVTGSVREQVRGKLQIDFAELGPQRVKNIAEPVQAYRVLIDTPVAMAERTTPLIGEGPSIAVLPFENMSRDPDQSYFSDGIAEDIITDMTKLSGLLVIARNSSFAFRDRSLDVKQIARELGARHILEGSVRKAANRIRVTAQLTDGRSGAHVWAERYDRDLEDIFAIQDEITRNIVEALKVELDLTEQQQLGGAGTKSIEAYDFMLRGREMLHRFSEDSNAEAIRLLEQSISSDPEYAVAYEFLSLTLVVAYASGWHDASAETLERGHRAALKAIELDPEAPHGHRALARTHLWRHELDQAIAEADKAVILGPSYADAYATLGSILVYDSRPEGAIESMKKAMQLDPRYPKLWLHFLAHAHFINKNFDEAVSLLKRRIRLQPETDVSRALLAACYGHLGLTAEARDTWAGLREINPDFSIERRIQIVPYRNPADRELFVDGLRKAGLPE